MGDKNNIMNERHRSTAFNIVSTLITKFVFLFGGFIISILLARLLGPEGKGIITAIFVFPLLIVSLADMGIRQSSAFYIGKKQYPLSDVISSISFLWLITSLISMTLVFVYFLIGPAERYSWVVLIIALGTVPIKLIEQYAKGIMLGRNQISTINISQILRVTSNFLAVILLVWILDLGVLGAALVHIAFATVVSVYYIIKVLDYNKISFKPVKPIPKLLFFKGISFAVVLFVINLNYKIDIMILDWLVDPAEIGIYSVGVNFAELLWQIPAAVGMVLFAKSATTKNELDSVTRSTSILRTVMPIMLITAIILAVFSTLVIKIFYGPDFIEAGNILRLLLPGICFITISKILHPDLAARGYPLYALKVFVITLMLNIILNFLLIPYYGIHGAAIASTISYILAGLGFGYVYARKENITMKDILIINKKDINLVKQHLNRKLNK